MQYKLTPILIHHHEVESTVVNGDAELLSALRVLAEVGAVCIEKHPTKDKEIEVFYPARDIKKILCESIGE